MAFKTRNWKIHNLPTFRLGLNDQQTPDEINDFELADVENFSVEEDSISTAPGYVQYDDNPQPGPFYGIYSFKKSDGTTTTIRQRKGVLEYATDAGETWATCTLPTTGSPAHTISLTQVLCSFVTLNDIVLWSNGYDTVMSSADGITWTSHASLPKSRKLLNNGKNRILFVSQPDDFSLVNWSNINDPLTVDPAAWEYIDPNNGQDIVTASLTPQGNILIHKEMSLYSVSDFVTDGMIDVNFIGNVSTTSPQCVVTTEKSVMWMGIDGMYEYIGGTIRKISGRIKISGRNQVTKLSGAVAAYYFGRVHISIPDADISQDYNSQEYIIYMDMLRDDPVQPYVITRNRRYFGCYGIELYSSGGEVFKTLYAADSRSDTLAGSPASYINTIFCYINDYRDVTTTQGLNGEVQPAFFVTKYFTENSSYFVKKYKKLFLNCKFSDSADIQIGYRFDPFSSFTMVSIPVTTEDIDWEYDDGTTGGWDDGFGFSQESIANLFLDIENTEKPRGIQFKVQVNEVNDVTNFGMSYKFQEKIKFK